MLNINSILPQIKLLEAMIEDGYEDKRTIQRRVDKFKEWLKEPELLSADEDVEYAAVIEIDLNKITEPIVACPNNPDDVATISEVLASDRPSNIDEVFVGSCMTNIGHYRALGEVLKGEGQVPVRLWVVPPTRMDEKQLTQDGYYSLFGQAGARIGGVHSVWVTKQELLIMRSYSQLLQETLITDSVRELKFPLVLLLLLQCLEESLQKRSI